MRYLLGILLLTSSFFATAWTPHKPTAQELKRLPPFCAWKFSGNPAAMKRGFARLGEQFKNSHHFCSGLNYLSRYYKSPYGPDAKADVSFARNEFTYMIEHLVPNSSLAAESYLYRGIAYQIMRQDNAAIADFTQAIRYKPTLAKAYIRLADYFSDHGQKSKALEIVSEGLRHSPNSRGLKRRYLTLGGKKPFPKPVKKKAAKKGTGHS